MSKRVFPTVVVGKKEDGLVWSTNNERMHVGKFGTVRNLNGLKTNAWRRSGCALPPLEQRKRRLGQPSMTTVGFARSEKAWTQRRRVGGLLHSGFLGQRAPTRQRGRNAHASGSRNGAEGVPRCSTVRQALESLDEVPSSCLIGDAETDRVSDVFVPSRCSTSVGNPVEGARRLGPYQGGSPLPWRGEDGSEHEDFHAKVSNITTGPVRLREPFASTVQSGIPRPKEDTGEDARDQTSQRSDGEKTRT